MWVWDEEEEGGAEWEFTVKKKQPHTQQRSKFYAEVSAEMIRTHNLDFRVVVSLKSSQLETFFLSFPGGDDA